MSIAATAALVERGDPQRFQAVMAMPVALRARLFPLLAFNLEVARIPWVTKEPMIAEMRLQWWRDVVAASAAGEAPRGHEVAGPLHEVIGAAALPAPLLERLIDARRWDIHRDPFADRADFDDYLDASAGSLLWAAALCAGAPEGAEGAVRDLGWAMGLAAFLAAVPELEARGRIPLVDGRPMAVAGLARDGLMRIARARAARGCVPRQVAPALMIAGQAEALLRQVQRDPMVVAEGRMQLSEFSRRGRLLWQALSGRW